MSSSTPGVAGTGIAEEEAKIPDHPQGSGKKDAIEEMLRGLDLRADEEEDVALEGNLEELAADARWLALARVHTNKSFSHGALFGNMRSAWNCAKEIEFRAMKDNLFSIQFNCLADWERVMDEGPWIFRECPVLLAPYDGWSDVDSVKLETYPAWVQIHDLKEKIRTASIAIQLARKAGPVIRLDNAAVKGSGEGVRVRVSLDVHKPLTRVARTTLNKKTLYFRLMYEKMPVFCGVCGLVGHITKEHGDGVHPPEAIQYPESLIAVEYRRSGTWMNGGGRGRGRGRGRAHPGRDGKRMPSYENSEEPEDELMDTASSPSKPSGKPASNLSGSSSKKRFNLEDDHQDLGGKGSMLLLENSGNRENEELQIVKHVQADDLGKDSAETSTSRDSKRQKKKDGSDIVDNDLATSAGSFEEHRRA